MVNKHKTLDLELRGEVLEVEFKIKKNRKINSKIFKIKILFFFCQNAFSNF